jgi:polar amino acid transport system substrate-binding protein
VAAGCLAALLLVGLAGCGGDNEASAGSFTPERPGTLVVATAFIPSPGFWEGPADQPTGGFERELAHALADRFDIGTVEVVSVDFSALTGGDLGGADMALSQLTPTDERDEVLDFSTPYLDTPPGVLVRPGTEARDLYELQRLTSVVVAASTLRPVVEDDVRPDEDPLVVDTRDEALAAIDAERVDALLLDLPVALALAHTAPERFAVIAQLPEPEGLAVALPDESENLQAVDSAIRSFQADGTIDELSDRWLGTELGGGADGVPLIRMSS